MSTHGSLPTYMHLRAHDCGKSTHIKEGMITVCYKNRKLQSRPVFSVVYSEFTVNWADYFPG